MHSHKEMQLPNFHLSAVHQSIHGHYILPVCLSPHIEGSLEIPVLLSLLLLIPKLTELSVEYSVVVYTVEAQGFFFVPGFV